MINKILKGIIILILSTVFVYADSSINLNISDNEINLDDYFNLEIQLNIEPDFIGGEIEIIGLEKFNQIGKQNSSSFSNINGVNISLQTITLSLTSDNIGQFKIGPAIIGEGDDKIISNIIDINILDNTVVDDELIENNTPIIEKYDIFGKLLNYSLVIIFILMIISLILVNRYNKNKENTDLIIDPILDNKAKIKILIKELKNIDKGDLNNNFYEELNTVFRKYFNVLGINNSDILTLKELKELKLDNTLITLFEKSYLNEFSDRSEILEDRDNIINNFLNILKV